MLPVAKRTTLIAAVELLEMHSQAEFNMVVLRLGLENEISSDTSLSVVKKCGLLGRIVVERGDTTLDTFNGPMTLGEAVIREAAKLTNQNPVDRRQSEFARSLARDGHVLVWDEYGRHASIRKALPEEIQLPQTDDEVHQMLKSFNLITPLGHLDQAIDAHARGDWAACNGQLRTFLESLFDDIAQIVNQQKASRQVTSENRRALLADEGFFAKDRNEWTSDGKNYINGLFKMLHTDGSHPGLSDEDHSTFRLHIVLVTARTFLRRLMIDKKAQPGR